MNACGNSSQNFDRRVAVWLSERFHTQATRSNAVIGYILKRLGLALLVALAVSAIAFFLLRLSGDIAMAIGGEGAQEADLAIIRKNYGLDRPLIVQYADWL